jgi:hypothetical protein
MLLTALWLYRDFPDVDLWVSTADEPSACGLAAPVLQFYVLTQDGRGGRTGAGAEGEGRMEFDLGQLLSGRGGWWEAPAAAGGGGERGGGAAAELPARTRGFPIVTADVSRVWRLWGCGVVGFGGEGWSQRAGRGAGCGAVLFGAMREGQR